jgi:HAD superfamily hydrolase (TIGR01509 family)
MKRYKAIFFDLGGVLSLGKTLELNDGVHKTVAKKLGLPLDQYFDSIDTYYSDAMLGRISKKQALKMMAKDLNTNPQKLERLYKQIYKENFKKNIPLYQFALKLKKDGYKISIISDIWPVAKDVLLDGKFNAFDDIVTSCDVGVRKICPEIFKIALKRLYVHPKEAIFTDNQKWNLPAPRKLGIRSFLFKNNKQFISELKKLGIA